MEKNIASKALVSVPKQSPSKNQKSNLPKLNRNFGKWTGPYELNKEGPFFRTTQEGVGVIKYFPHTNVMRLENKGIVVRGAKNKYGLPHFY